MNNSSLKPAGTFFGEGALLLMTIIWGGTFVIVKESLSDASPVMFVAFRFLIAGSVLLPIVLLKEKKLNREALLPGTFLGALLFLGFVTQTIGLKHTSATKSGFITGSLVVMVPIFQTIIEKKIPTRGAMMGTALVFLGIVFLSSGGSSITNFLQELGGNFNFGDTMTLICAAFFALHVVYIDILSPKYSFWTLLVSQLLSVSVMSFIAAFAFDISSYENIEVRFSSYLVFGLLYTSLLATLLNIGMQTKFQKVVSPTKAGIIYSFEPVFAGIFAFFLLNEKISNFGLLGSVLIFSGLIVSEVYDKIKNKNGKQSAES